MNTDKITHNQFIKVRRSYNGKMDDNTEKLLLRIQGMFPDRDIMGISYLELNEKQTTSSSSDTMVKPLIVKTVLPAQESVNNNNNESLSHNVSDEVSPVTLIVPPIPKIVVPTIKPTAKKTKGKKVQLVVQSSTKINFKCNMPDKIKEAFIKASDCIDDDVANLVILLCYDSGKIKCTDLKHNGIWYWSGLKKLWIEGSIDTLIDYITKIVRPVAQYFYDLQLAHYQQQPSEEEEITLRKFFSLQKKLGTSGFCHGVAKYVKERCYEPDFINTLNSNFDLFPLKGGQVLNIKTGEVRERVCEDYFTGECPVIYDPNASSPELNQFLDDVTLNDQSLLSYLQKILGTCLTGHNWYREIYIWYGADGSNGKTTLIELMRSILGFYFVQAHKDVFIKSDLKTNSSPYVAELNGPRMGAFCETEVGDKFNEGIIKALVGDDRIKARPLYKSPIEFTSRLKPFVITNHKPECTTDNAWWDRLVMIPFLARFVDNPDPTNPREKLKVLGFKDKIISNPTALSALLNWLIVGARHMYTDKPNQKSDRPDCVTETTETYRQEQDIYSQFIRDKVTISSDQNQYIPVKLLNHSFQSWCQEEEIILPAAKIYAQNFQRILGKSSTCGPYTARVKAYTKCSLIL